MFKVNLSNTYSWPVKAYVAQDGGKQEEQNFDAVFKRTGSTRVDEIRATIGTDKYDAKAICREVLTGWSGVEDANGEVPFSQGALAAVLEVPTVAPAIVLAFLESTSGSTRKN